MILHFYHSMQYKCDNLELVEAPKLLFFGPFSLGSCLPIVYFKSLNCALGVYQITNGV